MAGTYYTRKSGYERFCTSDESVSIHQLLAIAGGADPYKVFSGGEYNVHHKKPIPWLNTPENVELLTKADHNSEHWSPDILMGDAVTGDLCREMREQYGSGETITELSEKHGRANNTVHRHLRGDCSHTDRDITNKQKGPRDGPWRDRELFKEYYIDRGFSLKELAEEWGASQSAMSNWKRRHSL